MEERGDDVAHHDGEDYVDDATFLHGGCCKEEDDMIILSL